MGGNINSSEVILIYEEMW